ncbi:hypothetical protein Q669_29675 [Labrenzia sp. C1B10]|nr:hypothetical protein Q669_29675 [Labrenzia sp. C1B10]ERS05807.1 hypothetical protein Q675_29240 [Labrenzia sp. C1B70]
MEKKYRDGQNLGIRLGKWSQFKNGYLHVLDLDIRIDGKADEAFDKLESLFAGVDIWGFPRVQSGSGGKSFHIYLITSSPFPSKKLSHSDSKFTGKDGKDHWEWEIELFGTGKQVAIPPSVHPDTGDTYKWAIDWHDDCVIDRDHIESLFFRDDGYDEHRDAEDLEPLGLDIDEIESDLEMIQHWADDHTTWRNVGMALKHELGDEGWPVFDKWSRNGSGYDRRNNLVQWKAFKNDRGNPITMRTVKHAANEAHWEVEYETIADDFDDLEPEFDWNECLDDFEDLEDITSELWESCLKDFDDLDPDTLPVRKELKGIPANLLQVPGKLQMVVDLYNKTATKPQPQFAVQTALALGSVVCGRFYRTDYNNYSSLYLINVAGTGSGKEHSYRVIERVLEAAGREEFVGPRSYTSDSGVLFTLKDRPKHLTVIDEFGRYLSSNRRSGNSNAEDVQTAFMEMFSRVDGTYYGKGYSTKGMTAEQKEALKNAKVKNPSLTILGMTTPESLYSSLNGEDIASGFLNRLLMVESPISLQLSSRNRPGIRVPERLSKWVQMHSYNCADDDADVLGLMEGTNTTFEPVVIPFTAEAAEATFEMEKDIVKKQQKLKEIGMEAVLSRTREIAMRLSLIVALSCDHKKVELSDFEWAREYVTFYQMQMVGKLETDLGKSDDERIADKVFEIIKSYGDQGATYRHILMRCRSLQKLKPREKEDVLSRIKSDYDVTLRKIQGTRGPPTLKYVAKQARK